jgi:hypothetical protein
MVAACHLILPLDQTGPRVGWRDARPGFSDADRPLKIRRRYVADTVGQAVAARLQSLLEPAGIRSQFRGDQLAELGHECRARRTFSSIGASAAVILD